MTDIVERLRDYDPTRANSREAAAEIERLTEMQMRKDAEAREQIQGRDAELAQLRAALQEITDLCKTSPANPFLADEMDRIARAALEPKPWDVAPDVAPAPDGKSET